MKRNQFYSDEVLAMFCDQLHLMYQSGIPLDSGFNMVSSNSKDIPWETLRQSIKDKGRLTSALELEGHFPSLMIETLRVAEKVGQEAKLTQHLSTYFTHQADTKRFLKDILTMPFVLLSMLILVMAVLSYAVLPVFQEVFASFGGQSPWWIDRLLWVIRWVSILSLLLLIFVLGWVALRFVLHQINPQKYPTLLNSILKVLPKHQYQADLAHFSFIAQVLLASGLDQVEALNFLQNQLQMGKLLTQVKDSRRTLSPQAGLYDVLIQAKLYPSLIQTTLELSAKAGRLEETMTHISIQMQEEAYRSLSTELNRIEPTLVILLTLFVSTVLFSIILPLLGVLQVIGQ